MLERGASATVKFLAGEGPSTSGEWTAMPILSRVGGLVALAGCAFAIAMLVRQGGRAERLGTRALGAVAGLSFAAPLALALAGLDYVEPRNLIGSLVPLLVLAAAGLDVAMRRLSLRGARARGAPVAAAVGLSVAILVATATNPRLQRDDWRGLSALLARAGHIGVVLTQPPSAGKPLRYYFGHPLVSLQASEFPFGVRARTIVTLSRNPPAPLPDDPFRLASVTETAQGWRVATYRARLPRRVDAAELAILDPLGGNALARVDTARPVRSRPPRGRLASIRVDRS